MPDNTKTPRTTWLHIATALGVTRNTICEWRKRPDAPRNQDIEEWRNYMIENNLGIANNKQPADKSELQGEKIKREIALLDIKLAKERRQIIASDEIDKLLSHIASRQRAELLQFADTEAITLAGIQGENIGKMRDLLKGLVDRQCDYMEDGIKRWMRDIAK
jgi:hypothetical protein